MTDLTLTINSVDFRSIANKYGYKTDLEYVYGVEYQNLAYVTKKNLVRTRGILKIDTNYFTQSDLATLFNVLNNGIVTVTYFNNKLNATVTQQMEVTSDEVENRFKGFKTIGEITFTEL